MDNKFKEGPVIWYNFEEGISWLFRNWCLFICIDVYPQLSLKSALGCTFTHLIQKARVHSKEVRLTVVEYIPAQLMRVQHNACRHYILKAC